MRALLLILSFGFSFIAAGQNMQRADTIAIDTVRPMHYKKLIIPSVLIGYGIIGMNHDQIKRYNVAIRDKVVEDVDRRITLEDFSQYAPAVAAYSLNACGIEGRHNLKDRSIILLSSYIMMSTTIYGLKLVTKVDRPDFGTSPSFPSGHTGTAFASAEFLWQEYKDVSVWYGIAGYIVATGTGVLRIYNNQHWLTDVATGAGIGILSTKVAYWIHPYVSNKIETLLKKKTVSMIAPSFDGSNWSVRIVCGF